ncbi:MAG: DinB family protein [Planctomycetota bacterium]
MRYAYQAWPLLVAILIAPCGGAAELDLPTPPSAVEPLRNEELAELFAAMEASCEASQEVFRPLSAGQMNWRPPDGSHTPRWNAEHMTGRQLLFFSQIYAAIDPETHRVVDINPQQMPADYEAAHSDWTGDQEAAQMQAVSEYVRGFAALLEGEDLDTKAPGSRWTLRGLLKQMDRHFEEHTANVKKKFALDGWPPQ